MRLTIVHLLTFTSFLAFSVAIATSTLGDGPVGTSVGLALGLALSSVLTGPVLRWLCVWPLVPKCPRCGIWVQGFHRGAGPEGLLLVASPCGHAFVLRGTWVATPFRLAAALQSRVADELGWAIQPDGRVFRFRVDYAATLLDEDGGEIGRRRARWPYWLVRWTSS